LGQRTITNYYAKISEISLVQAELWPILFQILVPWQQGMVVVELD